MLSNVGLYSYLTSAAAFGILTLLLFISWRGKSLGVLLIIASGASTCWAIAIAYGTTLEYPPVQRIELLETIRNITWLLLLVELLGLRFRNQPEFALTRWRLGVFGVSTVAVIAVFVAPYVGGWISSTVSLHTDILFTSSLMLAITGLLLIEQLFRNADEAERWALKYLCLGLGGVFAYDFFMYSEGLLFRNLDPQLWQARGFVSAIAAPLIAVSASRNTANQFSLQVSRKAAFHSVTLVGSGIYLILVSIAGFYIKYMDATWGGILQVSFLVAACALLFAVMFSGKIRARTRVFLDKHFFSYRYDYREEWLKFTNTLGDIGDDVPEGIIRAMCPFVESPGGMLWGSGNHGHYRLLSEWQWLPPPSPAGIGKLAQWLTDTGWVIDLYEWKTNPDLYGDLEIPDWMIDFEDLWLIIPLVFKGNAEGVLCLKRSELKTSINWEDRDLLKTAGRQAATHLAQHMASEALIEGRQFEAFNRLSAYVVHDLKNILAQQSLMVSNAQKHKNNPAFVDDMIATVSNSVARMTKLMEQMRSGMRGSGSLEIDLKQLLEASLAGRAGQQPAPTLSVNANPRVQGNRERLQTVFGHLIQNAQDATEADGSVEVRLDQADGYAIVEIEDTGIGMEPAFVKSRLFKPFDSTKGLTGMGVGAFESRELVRSLGGDIEVTSALGSGTIFRIAIPLSDSPGNAP